MEEVIIKVSIEIILAIMIPLVPTGAMVIRYFWKKEKCFTLMKQKIDALSKSDSDSDGTHGDFTTKINDQGNRITAVETKVNMLLDHFKIEYRSK